MLLLVTAFCVMMVFVISGESEWTNAILFIILGGCTFLSATADRRQAVRHLSPHPAVRAA
ncbi:hypothetical protein U5640_43020 [Streptomyces sp. SS7]|uniref:hypothetical protein n=1 Tax=Streptomyces sp. SS7 TaxID=3108485 RepID=UPI0030EB5FEC